MRSFKLAPEFRAHNTRRNGCGTRPGFNAIIQHFPSIPMVCDLGKYSEIFLCPFQHFCLSTQSLWCLNPWLLFEKTRQRRVTGKETPKLSDRLYLGKWLIRLVDCWGMSSARVDYIAPWWTYWLHQFPHVNLRLQPLDHTFKPQDENYQQVRAPVFAVIQRFTVQTHSWWALCAALSLLFSVWGSRS